MTDPQDPSHHGVDTAATSQARNETMRLLLERSSCRSFYNRPIPDDILHDILRAGTAAATGGNLQPYSIIKITDQTAKEKLVELNEGQTFIAQAPVNLLFCIDWHRLQRWAELEKAPFNPHNSFRHFWISFQDTIIAAQNICTAADAHGLGSVYVGTVLECFRELRAMFNLPDLVFPVVLLTLGYPKARPRPKKKLGPDTVVHDEVYHDLSDNELLARFEAKYPGWKREITPERMAWLTDCCRAIGGEALVQACIEKVKTQGHINAVQNYFGLHYRTDMMAQGNAQFLAILKEFGFGWFEPDK